jgi:TonB family protein
VPEHSTIQVVQTTHEQFDEGAERVAARMRFSPARLGGAPVRVYVTLPISFSLH